jgi:hypothetical protein
MKALINFGLGNEKLLSGITTLDQSIEDLIGALRTLTQVKTDS